DAPQAYAATPDAPPYGQPANPDAPPDTDPAGYAPDAPAGYAPDGPPYTDPAGYAPDAPPYADPAGYAPDGPPYGQPDARPGPRGPAYGQPGAPGGPAYREPPWGPSAGVPMGAAPAGTAWPPPVGPPLGGEGDSLTGEVPVVPPAGPPPGPAAPGVPPPSTRGSFLVAAGILLSRCAGLIREVVIGAFLGVGPAADAFKAALRIPNLMQNLLGEGVLSASFIPVYARLRGEGRHEEAGRLAGAIAGLLIALTGAISLLGVLFTEPLTRLLVPGYSGRTFDLTVQLTRIMFPGMGFLVLSAWCLGVLNSHRKFFLSYVAPVIWNVAQIAFLLVGVLVVGGYSTLEDKSSLAVALAWGVLVGGVLQFAIQIGPVHRLLGSLRLSLDTGSEAVRSVLSRFVPVLLGRGCIQIMGWVDLWLASYLVTGAVSSLTYTMVLYLLPVSLFGVSVAAAELPDLSQVEVHDPETRRRFRLRLEDSMARIAWYVAPTATLFIVVGDVIVRAVLEHGSFSEADTVAVWLALAFLSMGLLPITASRLLQNGLYALDDARTPARLGVVGVVLAAVFGVFLMFPLDRLFVTSAGIQGWDHIFTFGPLPEVIRANPLNVPHLGIVGLAIGATMSDWIEYRLLSRSLAWRIGRTHLAGRWLNQIAIGCAVTAAVAYGAALAFSGLPALIAAALVTGPAAAAYLAVTYRLHVPEAEATVVRLQAAVNRARSGVR
ncbi:MAG TPA: murein biosynthesis integral membrane protein MurJ, partial [Acidimicrobiales bacterium]|nr:murein biosynthesis integral membrane protein MurJ [Acidimicrobiales bacterium]